MAEQEEIPIALYVVVGRIVVSWAYLEMAVDQCVIIAHKGCGGNNIEQDIPKTLKQKIKFLKKSFSELKSLSKFKDEGLALTSRVADFAEERHRLAHGAFVGIDPKIGSYKFVKLDYNKTTFKALTSRRTFLELDQIGKQILDLSAEYAAISNRMALNFPKSVEA